MVVNNYKTPVLSFCVISSRCLYSDHLFCAPDTLCLYPHHPLFVHTLYYVFVLICYLSTPVIVAGQSSTRQLCVCIYTTPSLSSVFEPSNVDFCFLCFNTDHTLYSVFVSGSSTILFSGNDLV